MTVGELTFINFCKKHRLKVKRIPNCNCPTPDFKLRLSFFHYIYIEIKDFEDTDDEKEALNDLIEHNNSVWGKSSPGNRIRSKIDNAKRQLKPLANEDVPLILLIFDNRNGIANSIYDYELSVAMYGLELRKVIDSKLYKFHGPLRRFTSSEKTYISYIGILESVDSLKLYENYFAKHKLSNKQVKRLSCIKLFKTNVNPELQFSSWI